MPQPQKNQRLSLSFLIANYGEQVMKQLADEQDCTYRHVFPKLAQDCLQWWNSLKQPRPQALRPSIAETLRENPATREEFVALVIAPVMEAFFEQAFPQAQQKPQIAQWIVRQYLTHRHNDQHILAEDLYKIKENIEYFDSLKKSQPFKDSGASADLLSYKAYTDFEDMLRPFQKRRMERDAKADMLFGIKPEQKRTILAETTILYDCPEGRVVVPHTPEASKFWGSHTRWCIAGREYAERYFPAYNARSPVIMLLPKGHDNDKVALVGKTLWNSEDHDFPELSEPHRSLMQACLDNLSAGAQQNITPWLPKTSSEANVREVATVNQDPEELAMQEALQAEINNIDRGELPNPDLWSNKKFVLPAVLNRPFLLKYASSELRGDHEIVLAASKEFESAFVQYAAPSLRSDREFMLAAVAQKGGLLAYADEELRQDPEVVLAAITNDAEAFRYATDRFSDEGSLHDDEEFVRKAFLRNNKVLGYAGYKLRKDPDFVSSLLEASEDLPFMITTMKEDEYDMGSGVWQLGPDTLAVYQMRALEKMLARVDIKKFMKYSRQMKSTWGDPDTLFVADPVATLAKIRADVNAIQAAKPAWRRAMKWI